MSSINALIALLGWVPLVLVLFAFLPARRAVVVGAVGAWLILPPVGIALPGFPDYDKAVAATVGILIGTAVFESRRLLSLRPTWVDLPMILGPVIPFLSSLSNNLGVYEALSASEQHVVMWLLPYLVGRMYFADTEGMREMAVGMLIGGLLLVPPIMFEIRMSPLIMLKIYGMGGDGTTRFGGWRPHVFLSNALELGLWMSTVTSISWWLWRSKVYRSLLGIPSRIVFASLFLFTILCRSTGAIILMIFSLATLGACWRFQAKWPMWAMLFAAPLYCTLRITGLWSGAQAVELSRILINESRARSLEYRVINDELMIAKVFQRPLLGWGRFGRSMVYDDYNRILSVTDGMWIVYLGMNGMVGLIFMEASMLTPAAAFIRRVPIARWRDPEIAASIAIATIVSLCMIDGLFNGQLNLLYVMGAGGLAGMATSRMGSGLGGRSKSVEAPASTRPLAIGSMNGSIDRYQKLGRSFKAEGRIADARLAWEHALGLMGTKGTTPDASWCDLANDLAWMLANTANEADRDVERAVELAKAVTKAHPESATYWNTLGAALYRRGDHAAAIEALDQARHRSQGGTPFDLLFLAMAHARIGALDEAGHAFSRATLLIEQPLAAHGELASLFEEARSLLESLELGIAAP